MDTHFDDDPFFTTLLQSRGGGCNSTPTQHSNIVVQATPNDEDNLLVSAWLNNCIDAIRGTDQKSTQMWERITTFYHEYKKPHIANRSKGSLMNRWSTIQKWTNKFWCNFTMEHYWCPLRHQPKWQQHISTLGKKRKSPKKDRETTKEEHRNAELKADLERSAAFELKKKKFETKMMLLDLSGLNAMQQEYFGHIQLKFF
ncbi:hypothetical protein CIPAW_01G098300 [Carya illinoinensis]|uniref:No apical meristem-associated C-terminal domain-containing protein n=1 Tax=Carya illinoinensis TaxID=32201 RepID=A0A8T1RKP5_CARIL|nr:hypothetical protein CIPAW_01G098300 [Carya illinoinensis]